MSQGKDKIKSQRGGPVDVLVKNRVKWPHEYILAGPNKERVSYNQLTVVQWVTGFCRTMREEHRHSIRDHMLDYMIALLDDAQDFSWQAAKASHAVLLCRMEQGEGVSWAETDKIERIRRANSQKHVTQVQNHVTGKKYGNKSQNKNTRTMPCLFQSGYMFTEQVT